MEQTQKSRMERDLEIWKQIEDKLVSRYGSKITGDKDFLKARRDIYKYIVNKYKNKRLSRYEKAELRILRGQNRKLLRQIYPNPYIRLIRNLLVFTGNVIGGMANAGFRIAKWLIKPDKAPQLPQSTKQTQQQKAPRQFQSRASQNKAVVRRMPPRSRVQMPQVRSGHRMRM